jgi:hypothetical protein
MAMHFIRCHVARKRYNESMDTGNNNSLASSVEPTAIMIPRAPKLPSDLAALIAFDGSDIYAYNALIRRVALGEADTLLAPCETVRPARRGGK